MILKVAIVHDWLTVFGGAERVLAQIIELFPEAELFSLLDFLPEKERVHLQGKKAKTTFIQKLPFAKRLYRCYLPLMPLAIEQLDLSSYNLVISSSFAVAKGVITSPDTLHICYCHTPARYLWDLSFQYLKGKGFCLGGLARIMLHKLRVWDVVSSVRVDYFVANSLFVAKRIQKNYRRDYHVIYPPVDVDTFSLYKEKQDFYLTASRLVPYKKIDCIVKAFCQMPDKRLVVIGDGPELATLKKLGKGRANISFLGYQSPAVLVDYMQKAKAFVFAALEDFGIAPVEALSCGTPVIAFGKGGVLETVRGLDAEKPTGCFFDAQTDQSVVDGVKDFEKNRDKIKPEACRERALSFSNQAFQKAFTHFVKSKNHR